MSEVLLDSSALIALIRREPGWHAVAAVLDDAAIFAHNLCEVITKLVLMGESPEEAVASVNNLRLSVLPVDHELALQSADLCMHAKTHGLSLGDRLCLAGARSYRLPVLTTDSEWGKVRLRGVTVRLIRGKATRA